MMSERQKQWLEAGITFEENSCKGYDHGLCAQINKITGDTRHYGIISGLLNDEDRRFPGSAYWLNFTSDDRLLRAFFAYLMAAMTDRERDAICEGL